MSIFVTSLHVDLGLKGLNDRKFAKNRGLEQIANTKRRVANRSMTGQKGAEQPGGHREAKRASRSNVKSPEW